MERLISLLADALSAACGDLVETRADLATSIDLRAAAQQAEKDLRQHLEQQRVRRAQLEVDLENVVGLVRQVVQTRDWATAAPEYRKRGKRKHAVCLNALQEWLAERDAKEIPF